MPGTGWVGHVNPGSHPPHAQKEDPQCMETTLVHECAGHDHVIAEMASQEPRVGVDVRLGPDDSQPEPSALRIEMKHPIQELHGAAGNGSWIFHGQVRESVTEARREMAVAEGLDRVVVVGLHQPHPRQSRRRTPVVGPHTGLGSEVHLRMNDAFASGELFRVEEPRASFLHAQQGLPVHRGLEVEAKQMGVALSEELVDGDVVANGLAGPGKTSMESNLGVQETVDGGTFGNEVDAPSRPTETDLPGRLQQRCMWGYGRHRGTRLQDECHARSPPGRDSWISAHRGFP